MARIVALVCLFSYTCINANAQSSNVGGTDANCWALVGMATPAVQLHEKPSAFLDVVKLLVEVGNTNTTSSVSARECLLKLYHKLPRGAGSFGLAVSALASATYLNTECRSLAVVAGDVEKHCRALRREAEVLMTCANDIVVNELKKNGKDGCTSLKPVLHDCQKLADKLPAQIQRINELLEAALWNMGKRWVAAAAGLVGSIWGAAVVITTTGAAPALAVAAVPIGIAAVQKVLETAKENWRSVPTAVQKVLETAKENWVNAIHTIKDMITTGKVPALAVAAMPIGIVAVPMALWWVPDPQKLLETAKENCVSAEELMNELIHTIKDEMAVLSCEY